MSVHEQTKELAPRIKKRLREMRTAPRSQQTSNMFLLFRLLSPLFHPPFSVCLRREERRDCVETGTNHTHAHTHTHTHTLCIMSCMHCSTARVDPRACCDRLVFESGVVLPNPDIRAEEDSNPRRQSVTRVREPQLCQPREPQLIGNPGVSGIMLSWLRSVPAEVSRPGPRSAPPGSKQTNQQDIISTKKP